MPQMPLDTVELTGYLARIRRLHSRILCRSRLDTRDVIQIGRLLTDIKSKFHDSGRRIFRRWAEENLVFSYRQVNRYMKLFRFAKGDNLSPKLQELPLCEAYERAGIIRFAGVNESIRRLPAKFTPPEPLDTLPLNQIFCGDAQSVLKALPSDQIHACVTSPPYFRVRDHGVDGQIGQESSVEEYLKRLVAAFNEVQRVLRPDGTLWLVIGDCYASVMTKKVRRHAGLSPKNLLGIPWRLAFALQSSGWILRTECIWEKPSVMPESVMDRPTRAHEYVFMFSKTDRYFYDADTIREPHMMRPQRRLTRRSMHAAADSGGRHRRPQYAAMLTESPGFSGHPSGRNKRTIWTVPATPTKSFHPAAFPLDLIKPMILAGCPSAGVVVDPFCGIGTTAFASKLLDRSYIGIELNPDYCEEARLRLSSARESPSVTG